MDETTFFPWRHGLAFGLTPDGGTIVVQKRSYGPEDVGNGVPADAPLPGPVMYEHPIPRAHFIAILGQLGLVSAEQVATEGTNTPGEAAPPVAGEE